MHIEKFKIEAVVAMVLHYQRGREGTLERENIDKSRTHLNYEIGERFDYADIKNIMELVKKGTGRAVRKDAVLMADVVITAPPNCEDTHAFFESAFNAVKQQLVENGMLENTKICGYVHMDETSPHMHLAYIPLKHNKNKQPIFSFKQVCNRSFYANLHEKTEELCERDLGYRPNLLIAKDDDLNSLLSRADIDQKAYKQLRDKLTKTIDDEITAKKGVLDALKVKLERLEKASRYKMNASQKQQIQSLQGKLNQLKQTSKLALTDSQLNEIDKLRNRLANLSSKYTLEQQIEIAGLKKKKQIYQQTLETLSKPLSKELQAQVDYWNA